MPPSVSVIVPAYNVEPFIEIAVGSVLEQTDPDLEVVVVDDGSTDGTVDAVQRINDDRVRLVCNKGNFGSSVARNRAIACSTGEWIAILDADDWLVGDRIERLKENALSAGADMIADDVQFTDETGAAIGTLFAHDGISLGGPEFLSADDFIQARLFGTPTQRPALLKPLIRRSFLIAHGLTYDSRVPPSEDYLLYALCLTEGARFLVVPNAGYCYRQRSGSLSRTEPPLRALHGQIALKETLLAQPYIAARPHLQQALHEDLRRVRHEIAREGLLQAVKRKSFWRAAEIAVRKPAALAWVTKTGWRSLMRRTAEFRLG